MKNEYDNKPATMRDAMDALAMSLDVVLNGNPDEPRKSGFVLLLFPFEDKSGLCNYVSNGADRHHIVRMFKKQIELFEQQFEKNGSEI
jgi:hypothetical protein